MKGISKSKISEKYKLLLEKHNFIDKTASSLLIQNFSQLTQSLVTQILDFGQISKISSNRSLKLQLLIKALNKMDSSVTITLISKKIAVIFFLIRKMVIEGQASQEILAIFQEEIGKISKQQLSGLSNKKQKRSSSITKLYGYIRELSGSKDKYNNTGKTGLENEKDRGALKEIITQIFEPLCLYLNRLIADKDSYRSIIQKKERISGPLLWKMINFGQTLGKIVYQLYRFGRYFVNELAGILVLLTIICSKDLAHYYDILANYIALEAEHFRVAIKLEDRQRFQNIYDGNSYVIFKDPSFLQLKGCLQQLNSLRQQINYVFGNKNLRNYRSYFYKPSNYKLKEDSNAPSFDFLLEYYQRGSKAASKRAYPLLISISSSQAIFSRQNSLPQIKSKFSDNLSSPNKNVKQQNVDFEGEMDGNLIHSPTKKPRLNTWLNRAQKSKIVMSTFQKQELVSTIGSL